jgi:N-acetylneuraminate lyase
MKIDTSKFHGIFPAFYACYDDYGNICKKKVKNLARWLSQKGVNGLYLTGSSGESFLQTKEERKLIVESVMEEVGDKLTVIVHTGSASTREAVELSKYAKGMGVHAISAVPNVYYSIPEACIENHWDMTIEAAKLPFIIYNIPQTTGYNISMSLFKKMVEKDYVIGIKNTSASAAQINMFRRNSPKGFIIFNGPDDQLLAGRMLGADGGIGGTYGCMPELYVKLNKAIEEGNMNRAILWQNRINTVIDNLRKFPSTTTLAAAKAVLNARGVDIGGARLPMITVPSDDPNIIEIAKMIEEWVKLD